MKALHDLHLSQPIFNSFYYFHCFKEFNVNTCKRRMIQSFVTNNVGMAIAFYSMSGCIAHCLDKAIFWNSPKEIYKHCFKLLTFGLLGLTGMYYGTPWIFRTYNIMGTVQVKKIFTMDSRQAHTFYTSHGWQNIHTGDIRHMFSSADNRLFYLEDWSTVAAFLGKIHEKDSVYIEASRYDFPGYEEYTVSKWVQASF